MARILAWLLIAGFATSAMADEDFKREGAGEKRAQKDELEGKTPPPLEVRDWKNTDGKEIKLADLKGKVVLIDFWGVWCGPCRKAMPHLKELHEKHKDKGLVIIGVHTTNKGDEMAKYVDEEGLPWYVAIDIDKKTTTAFRVDSYPDYYLIDKAGILRVADLQNADVDRALEILLKE